MKINLRIRPGLVIDNPQLKNDINWYDSGLSVQQEYTVRTIDTNQGLVSRVILISLLKYYSKAYFDSIEGPSFQEYVKLCESGLHALIVRHPILRFISAWNDKFSWNSTAG